MPPVFERRLVGLRGLDLGLSAGGLRADVGIIELQQELALAHVIAFLDQQAFYRGRDGGVSLKDSEWARSCRWWKPGCGWDRAAPS